MSTYVIKMRYVMDKPGFLLIELMIAIVIGLILISALMRMQVILLELQDSFCMRDTALVMAAQRMEIAVEPGTEFLVQAGRDFKIDFERQEIDLSGSNSFISKIKVGWRSLSGKNCYLQI